MSPASAVSWLMPRLMDFQVRHLGITLMLNPAAAYNLKRVISKP